MVGILEKRDKLFPEKVRIFTPDVDRIYYEGNLELLKKTAVAVVGSRKCTPYGRKISGEIGKKLGNAGITVVSGLARGIDTESHIGAVNTPGKTIAVVAGGTDQFYPPENRDLQRKIADEGLLLSLKPPGYKCRPFDFPIRNKVISAISDSVVIVEATSRSGALITAECAMEHGKDVYALPGNITSIYSFGTNTLIKEGAIPLVVVDDLLRDFGKNVYINVEKNLNLGNDETLVIDVLREYGEMTIEEIYHKTNIHPLDLNGIMTVLEIKGIVFSAMGKFFVANFKE